MKVTPTSHLVGNTRYKMKRKFPPGSTTAGNNRGRPGQLVSYCPECPPVHPADPEKNVRVGVSPRTKIGKCPAGHRWEVI